MQKNKDNHTATVNLANKAPNWEISKEIFGKKPLDTKDSECIVKQELMEGKYITHGHFKILKCIFK